jgi:hypothetical protein
MDVPTLLTYAKELHCIAFHMQMIRGLRQKNEGKLGLILFDGNATNGNHLSIQKSAQSISKKRTLRAVSSASTKCLAQRNHCLWLLVWSKTIWAYVCVLQNEETSTLSSRDRRRIVSVINVLLFTSFDLFYFAFFRKYNLNMRYDEYMNIWIIFLYLKVLSNWASRIVLWFMIPSMKLISFFYF